MTGQQGIYSEDKMLWWYAREQRLPASPKQVHWVLSDLCNQDCVFCSYRVSGNPSNELFVSGSSVASYGHDNPVRWIDTSRALALVDELKAAGVLAVQFTGGGEPTVHPEHERIFKKTLEAGMRCALVSNAIRWKPPLLDLLVRFDWVRISIDAATCETYAKIRRVAPGSFDTVLGNLRRLSAMISGSGCPAALGVGFTVTPDNYTEIRQAARLARDNGAHNIRLSAMFSPENEKPFEPLYDRIAELIAQTKADHSRGDFTVYDNFGSRFSDLVQHNPDYQLCPYQYYTTYIGGDAKLYRCCVLSYSRRGMIESGDLRNQRFDTYWKSPQRLSDFAEFDAHGCPRCMFNGKNRSLLYVMGSTQSGPARHVEWP